MTGNTLVPETRRCLRRGASLTIALTFLLSGSAAMAEEAVGLNGGSRLSSTRRRLLPGTASRSPSKRSACASADRTVGCAFSTGPASGRTHWAWAPVHGAYSSLTDAGATSVGGDEARSWTGQIPGSYVTTTGVDYFLEAYEDASLNRLPPSATVGLNEPLGGYFHVTTVSPPLIQHTPPLYAYSVDEACRITSS